MTSEQPGSGPALSSPRPFHLPWYVHVNLMVFALVTVFFGHVLFGPRFYLWGCAPIIPGIYLAVAGKGNRLFFSVLLVLVNAVALAGIAMLEIEIDKLGVIGGLLVCILVVLWPAALLWLAHTLNTRRRRR
ncbi:hypothetical protein HF313_20415 [Massilia atriviolacea]|uniref:Uncharacterized protein n=1 Tax=Massilia atriviolacea TaxID=2495579 RepID=A0A430HS68_9BURK|nr:hypothetical protein [Massilia atriviolacea]RSZ60337.1 hypothetical protein EJB06_04285 [Massilia atriviolacea]